MLKLVKENKIMHIKEFEDMNSLFRQMKKDKEKKVFKKYVYKCGNIYFNVPQFEKEYKNY